MGNDYRDHISIIIIFVMLIIMLLVIYIKHKIEKLKSEIVNLEKQKEGYKQDEITLKRIINEKENESRTLKKMISEKENESKRLKQVLQDEEKKNYNEKILMKELKEKQEIMEFRIKSAEQLDREKENIRKEKIILEKEEWQNKKIREELDRVIQIKVAERLDIEKENIRKERKILEEESKENKRIKEVLEDEKRKVEQLKSNLTALPYMAGVMADYLTYDIEVLAKQLDWGNSIERKKKVISIREIRKNAKQKIEEAKNAEYQLAYLLELYPELEEILEIDFNEIPLMNLANIEEVRDRTKDYLSKEEWDSLETVEKNQLALDRYVEGRKKSKWQIGRDYELYVGYCYEKEGYSVDYCGSYLKMDSVSI